MNKSTQTGEGGLDAPQRHPIAWRQEEFYDEAALHRELERVFDICHGCRRCVSLCESFPVLFDLIDESENFDVQSVAPGDYTKVSQQCYLCDLCYQTKCPYVPPHPWQVDFPHLMLRAKAHEFRTRGAPLRDHVITATHKLGVVLARPGLGALFNRLLHIPLLRWLGEKLFGIHRHARLPRYEARHLFKRLAKHRPAALTPRAAGPTRGKVMLFASCHTTWSRPEIGEDLVAVFEHNGIPVQLLREAGCCGMPKMELGDLEAVERTRDRNIPLLAQAVDEGFDILSTVPSCVLMFRQELPLLFPEDEAVQKVAQHVFDPFEYLHHRHRAGLFNTSFPAAIGTLAYQAACHQRVQNIGSKTRDILALIPGAEITVIERCTGHDGTYAVRRETHENSMKLVAPVARRVTESGAAEYTSDCPLAAQHIAHGLDSGELPAHPLGILRRAYQI